MRVKRLAVRAYFLPPLFPPPLDFPPPDLLPPLPPPDLLPPLSFECFIWTDLLIITSADLIRLGASEFARCGPSAPWEQTSIPCYASLNTPTCITPRFRSLSIRPGLQKAHD